VPRIILAPRSADLVGRGANCGWVGVRALQGSGVG
jgi:hypothetical protein